MTINTRTRRSDESRDMERRKLAAFADIEESFIVSFSFAQEVHGQTRFNTFPIAQSVRYLHSLYVCELKDRLLSVLKNIERYEGERCLELLRDWQEGQTAEVVAFIHRKLDNQPFAELCRQLEAAERVGDLPRARRLTSGRMALLNRNFNLSHALDAIFTLEPERMRAEVSAACKRYWHTPAEIDRQLAELRSDVCAYAPSAALARRNMLVMNRLGPHVMGAEGDRPGERTDRVLRPASPAPSYAEEEIVGEMTLLSLDWIPRRPPTQPPLTQGTSTPPGSQPIPSPE